MAESPPHEATLLYACLVDKLVDELAKGRPMEKILRSD